MNIEGVPVSIPFSKVAAMLTELGLPVADIPTTPGVTFGSGAITASVYARDENGELFAGPDGKTIAMHHVSIRIDHEET